MHCGRLLALSLALLLTFPTLHAAHASGPVATPTPAPAGGVYDPMRSFAPLVDAVAPAVVKIEDRKSVV